MAHEVPPRAEGALVDWSSSFLAHILSTPTAYGLVAGQATAYQTLHDAFVAARALTVDPETRSPAKLAAKNLAMKALVANARMLIRIIQATPTVTDEQRVELGINVRDAEPTPIPAPGAAPTIIIQSVVGHVVRFRLRDAENPDNRGRPPGVDGAAIFSHVGNSAPTDPKAWTFEGNTSETVVEVAFPDTVPNGAQVFITAFWFNPRSESGPANPGVSTFLQGGGVMVA